MDTSCPPVPVALVHPVPTVVSNGPACLPAPPVTPPPPVPTPHAAVPPSPQPDAEEVLVDCQSILFSENPFVLANKRRSASGGISLGGPPRGYGNSGILKTTVYSSKTPSGDFTTGNKRDAPSSPSPSSTQQASINFLSQGDSPTDYSLLPQ
ncbi:protein PRRC1-like [Hyla sarda]|uniref:protein PRRC1-like n=1 Tax=Hyla sarda TaxID=327740 RepID=UPI0024C3F2E3|nr:protein PRRC1-like [Hyla sarda]